jgi:ATP/ADP translocase/HEAT repeat protein
MKRWLRSIIDVRKGEVALTLLMFLYYYLLLVTYYFLKPARDSLFLVKLGASQLPIVFMLIAVIVVPVTTLYSQASQRLKLNQLINFTTAFLIINLLLLRWLLQFTHPSVFYTFYIWVSIYGAITTSQFWLFANATFDATQAKRLFVLFGLGGIIGAFTGGEVTSVIIDTLGVATENLLLFCVAFLALCIVLVNVVWRVKQKEDVGQPARPTRRKQPKENYADLFKLVKRSKHLLLIVGIIAMTMATASFVDYQFKTVSVLSFPAKQDLTAFLGKFYGRLSLIAFLFQLFLSYRLLRLFGVGGAIFLLPLGLLGGSIAMLLLPGLMSAVLIRGTDGVFRYSIDKTGRELLFLPVPLEIKKRTKVFIDVFVDRWFRGFAGGVLLLLVGVLHFSVRQLSIVVVAMLVIWLFMVFRMRREYVEAFRRALEKREIDPGELTINIAEASTLATLRAALGSSNDRQIIYSLDMLHDVQDSEILGAVKPLLSHESPDIRAKAIEVLRSNGDDSLIEEMEGFLEDEDPGVRLEAMHYLCDQPTGDRIGTLQRYLSDDSVGIRSAAIGCIADHGSRKERDLLSEDMIRELLTAEGSERESTRVQIAEAMGSIQKPAFKDFLRQLLDDPSTDVVNEAMRSAGRTGDREFVPRLLERVSDRRFRKGAREALSTYGDRVTGTLSDYICDVSYDFAARSNLCRVLRQIPTQHSVDTLISILDVVEPAMKYHAIKALNYLRANYPRLRFHHEALGDALVEETESYYTILQILSLEDRVDNQAERLLRRALEEKVDENLERIFRLLGLTYSQKDMHGAYLGIISNRKQLYASAVEFLDNVLKKEVKKYLFPIVDPISMDLRIRKGQELFGVHIADSVAALKYLIEGRDPWLKACAIFTLTADASAELKKLAKETLGDPNAVVRETARLVS